MAKKCSLCGRKIGVLENEYGYQKINNREHYFCLECREKIRGLEQGKVTLREITTAETHQDVLDYYKQPPRSEEDVQRLKTEANRLDPLYEEIHQIAEDLRFIKNYLIFCITVGIIWGLITLFAML